MKAQDVAGVPMVVDVVAGVNNGTFVGAVLGNDATSIIDSGLGPGLSFDRSRNQYVSIPTTGFSATTGSFGAWFRMRDSGANSFVWGNQSGAFDSMYLYTAFGTGQIVATFAATAVPTGFFAQDGQLYHAMVTWNANSTPANQYVIYLNGVQLATGNYVGAIAFAATMALGWNPAAAVGQEWSGEIFEPRAYNRVLTAAQVQELYLAGAKAVQHKTDFGAPVSVANEGGVARGTFSNTDMEFFNAAGGFRVALAAINGEQCKTLAFPGSGIILLRTSRMRTSLQEAAYGTWDFWMYKSAAGNVPATYPILNAAATVGYGIEIAANGTMSLVRYLGAGGVALMATAAGRFTTAGWHRVRLVRTYAGAFYLYDDITNGNGHLVLTPVAAGTNPVTDTNVTTSDNWVHIFGVNDALSLGDRGGDHCMVKYLGAVHPT